MTERVWVTPTVALVRERLGRNAAKMGLPHIPCPCCRAEAEVLSRPVPTWEQTGEIIEHEGLTRFARRAVIVACTADGCQWEHEITGVER